MKDLMSFTGRDVLVVGGATGMGAAVAKMSHELGARVTVLDVAEVEYPVHHSARIDLRSQASVDEVLAQLDKSWAAVYICAGVGDGTPSMMQINFISQRYLLDSLMQRGNLVPGSAVVMISSVGGMSWRQNLEQVSSFLACDSWEACEDWIAANEGTDTYAFSKQAMCAYVACESMRFLKQGVRLNSVMPGPTDTPLARAKADLWLGFGSEFREEVGLDPLTPEQIASSMLFLASPMAAGVNGANMMVDFGHMEASTSGAWEEPAFSNPAYSLGK